MKRVLLGLGLCLLVPFIVRSQQADEQKVVYQLAARALFAELDSTRQIITDTIYETSAGFRIFPDYIVQNIGGVLYVIIRYPIFSKGGIQRSANYKAGIVGSSSQIYVDLAGKNGKILCIPKAVFDTIPKVPYYKLGRSLVGGQLTLPFKLRPKQGDKNFQMTTDVTLGAYIGLRQRISRKQNYYLTVPATLGLTFVNITENSTLTTAPTDDKKNIVPGWTWSSGLIGQFNNINAGFVFGVDYASGVGNDWIYNKKIWYSFAIGFSFLK